MLRKTICLLSLCLTTVILNPTTHISSEKEVPNTLPVEIVEKPVEYEIVPTVLPKTKAMETEAVPELAMSENDIALIALITMAEAEGECERGKRLVIDTILNRVDSELAYFPDTVRDVIYQQNAFTSVWNGRIDRCYVDEYICELVREELVSRTNSEVMYFTAGKYGQYGAPMFKVGNHYFSSK